MKKSWPLILAAALPLAVLSWWWVRDSQERAATNASSAQAPAPGVGEAVPPRTVSKSETGKIPAERNFEAATSTGASAADWGERLQGSDDYWAFAESAIGPAKSGDGDARYWLALALNDCKFVYTLFFMESLPGQPLRHLTLDEARQHAVGMQGSPYSADDMDLLEKRCSRLSQAKDSPFGDGNEWMDAARAINNPLAQAAEAAMKSLMSLHVTDPEQARIARAEVRRLSVEAARAGNPEALMHISSVAENLAYKDEAEGRRRRLSWMLAACTRTPDCDGLTLWRKMRCNRDTQCQPFETPRDIIRRDAGSDFDEVERRARELNEKIDAGALEESDI